MYNTYTSDDLYFIHKLQTTFDNQYEEINIKNILKGNYNNNKI